MYHLKTIKLTNDDGVLSS